MKTEVWAMFFIIGICGYAATGEILGVMGTLFSATVTSFFIWAFFLQRDAR